MPSPDDLMSPEQRAEGQRILMAAGWTPPAPPWPEGAAARMTVLAELFPTLARGTWPRPFDVTTFLRWSTKTNLAGTAAGYAAEFVADVWYGGGRRFDVVEAMRKWDDAHRAAFVAWARNPWACPR